MGKILQATSENLVTLLRKLDTVLRSEPISTQSNKNAVPNSDLVPLAQILRDKTEGINSISSTIISILERLEL